MPELLPFAPLTPDWHAARRQGVTATDIVTILGLSTYDSVYSLFWRKLQQIPETESTTRMELGRVLQPYVRELWNDLNDDSGPTCHAGDEAGLWRNNARSWQMASPDYLVYNLHLDEGMTEPIGVLECKTWADADRHSWDNSPPARVRAQVLWQMDVMDAAAGHVGVVFLPSGEFRSYTIKHPSLCDGHAYDPTGDDPRLLCSACGDIELMRAAGEEFMARLRLELPPPDPDSSAATLAAVRARFTRQPAKQAEVDEGTWIAWATIRDRIKEHETAARALEIQIREQAGEAQVLCVDGQPVARRVISDAQVKAHTRHQDYLKRIELKEDDGA